MDGVYCPKPSGAFYRIARLPIDNADKFCQWLLESFSGRIRPLCWRLPLASTRPDLGTDEVRIAYVPIWTH